MLNKFGRQMTPELLSHEINFISNDNFLIVRSQDNEKAFTSY